MSHRDAVALSVRKAFAVVLRRSLGGTPVTRNFTTDVVLTRQSIDDIRAGILAELGVDVPVHEWLYFSTIADVVTYINDRIRCEYVG